jgi:hypothetical protein
MYNYDQIEKLRRLAEKSMEQLKQEINIFDEQLAESIRNAPEEQKSDLEKCKSVVQQAIALAKMGKAEEANELILNFQKSQNAS